MKFLKLPVRFIDEASAKEINHLKELDLEVEINEIEFSYEGTLYVNPASIVCFNEDSENMVNLALMDGINHKIFMKFEDFVELMDA